jgi:hypothetical protein
VHCLAAQTPSISRAPAGKSCLDTVSMAHAIPSIVYVRAAIKDSVDPGVGSTLDLFAQSVVAQFRLMLRSRGECGVNRGHRVADEEHAPKRNRGEDRVEAERSGANRWLGGAEAPSGQQSGE